MHLIIADCSPAQQAFVAAALAERQVRLSVFSADNAQEIAPVAAIARSLEQNFERNVSQVSDQGGSEGGTALLLNCCRTTADALAGLRRCRKVAALANIPAILLMPAVKDCALAEMVTGAQALGANYALADDGDAEALRFIIDAVRDDVGCNQRSDQHAADAPYPLRAACFSIHSFDDARQLAPLLAAATPRREAATLGISELLINGIEHGNLGVSYALKRELRREGRWREEIERRSALPENRDKRVRIRLRRIADETRIEICDEGPGFDWQRYLDFDPGRASDPNGRGIAVARMTSFDSLNYLSGGRTAVARIKEPCRNQETRP